MIRLIFCAFIASVLHVPQATALDQAFCALRDPDTEIFSLFPEGDSYRSVVHDISKEEISERIAKDLGTPLHFSELGKHTVYVVYKGEAPIGLVHARPELGKWGIVEIAWALDLDLTIKDFAFMRCRDRSKKIFQGESAAREIFLHENIDSLRGKMVQGSFALDNTKVSVPDHAAELANTLLLNALKTLVVTDVAWGEEIAKLKP